MGVKSARSAGKQTVSPLSSSNTNPSAGPASRVRAYLRPKQGRYWDPNSPDTPEGRLSKYNPEDWYVPAKNEHDHHRAITVEFPDPMLDELSKYVNSGRFPLGNSNKQAIRVAVFEFLQILRKLEPVEDSHMALIETLVYLHKQTETTLRYEEQFQLGREDVHRLHAAGAVNEARKRACDLITLAKKIESREIREMHVQRIQREFRGLLKTAKKKVKANVRKNAKVKQHKARSAVREPWEEHE